MTEPTELTPKFYAVHIADEGAPPDHVRPDTVEQGAGMIEVGVELGGRRLALQRFKADDIMAAVEREQQTDAGEQNQTGA